MTKPFYPPYWFLNRVSNDLDLGGAWLAQRWGAQPTDAEYDAAQQDLTVVDGQTYSQWRAENGGEPAPTARNRAAQLLDSSLDPDVMAHRAEFRTQFDELNAQVQRITQILVDAGAVNGFAPFQALVASIEQTQPIPPAEQQTRARDFIESGGADTPPV